MANNRNYEVKEKEEQDVIDVIENEEFHDVPDVIDEETHPAERRRRHHGGRYHDVPRRAKLHYGLIGFIGGALTTAVGAYVLGKYGFRHSDVSSVVQQVVDAPQDVVG